MGFAQNLAYCMEQRGYSAYRLAQILDVNNQSVLNWVAGESKPHTKNRKKIAEHFGITLEALDGDNLPKLPPKGAKKEPPSDNDAEQLKAALDRILGKLSRENQLLLYEYAIRLDERNLKDDG